VHWEKIPNEAFIGDIKNVGQKKMVTDIAKSCRKSPQK
jgi:hypothetical protein